MIPIGPIFKLIYDNSSLKGNVERLELENRLKEQEREFKLQRQISGYINAGVPVPIKMQLENPVMYNSTAVRSGVPLTEFNKKAHSMKKTEKFMDGLTGFLCVSTIIFLAIWTYNFEFGFFLNILCFLALLAIGLFIATMPKRMFESRMENKIKEMILTYQSELKSK